MFIEWEKDGLRGIDMKQYSKGNLMSTYGHNSNDSFSLSSVPIGGGLITSSRPLPRSPLRVPPRYSPTVGMEKLLTGSLVMGSVTTRKTGQSIQRSGGLLLYTH